MKKVSLMLSAVAITTIMLSSCGGGASNEVTIGNQVWMTKNLNVDKFRNGDPIPEAKTEKEWESAGKNKQPAWCYYDNDPANGEKYGKLYNWYAVNDPRGLAPKGWHVPTDAEWTVLTNHLGGEKVAGKKIKSTSGWEEGGNGTNSSGFSGLPSGNRGGDGRYSEIGYTAVWWSSTEYNPGGLNTGTALNRSLNFGYSIVFRAYYEKRHGYSVRCLKD